MPTFSYVDFTRDGGMSAVASASMAGNCIAPVGIGFKVKDAEGNVVEDVTTKTVFSNGEKTARYTFRNLPSGKLELYPVVNLFGFDILAAPTATLEMECPAKIIDFKQTSSAESESGFYYNGKTYKYKFEVATTVECSSDNEDIADWGYVYEDPNGSIARISLRDYYSPYTDTRYVYYRNEPSSTARLYGYVRYAGDTEYVYDEPHDYPLKHSTHRCPDNHHPHMIDLGLPSGTKWACCNAGASKPEDYGGYYEWGQIADAPSLAQIQELINSCSSVWTTLNGVNGRLFTGPNGGQVFLPAAGSRWYGELDDVGSWADYWSSTLYEYDEDYAYTLAFLSGSVGWGRALHFGGLSVRRVAR